MCDRQLTVGSRKGEEDGVTYTARKQLEPTVTFLTVLSIRPINMQATTSVHFSMRFVSSLLKVEYLEAKPTSSFRLFSAH